MKNIKGLLFILTLLVLSSFISAGPIIFESYLETVDMESKDKVHETIEIIANFEQSHDFIEFLLIVDILNLEVYLDDTLVNCEITPQVGRSDIFCSFEESISGKHFLKIEFDSSYPLIQLKNKLMFRSSYDPVIETKEFIYILKLPLGYIIPQEPGRDDSFFISPDPDLIYSDGQRIILKWKEKPLDKEFDVSVISEKLTKPFNLGVVILTFILIILLSLLLILYFKKKPKVKRVKAIKKKRKLKIEIIEEHLMESEKAVIRELRNADKKELWQKQLELKTEFSKAKLSRVIRNLEARNIIQKIPFGNTNKIKLKIS